MKKRILFLIIIICGLLQVTILNNIRVFNAKPDLLLICMVLASLTFELKWAFALSVFCGVFKDIFFQAPFGINTLLFSLWCLLIVELAKKISIDFDLIKIGLILIVSIFHNIVIGIIVIYAGNFIPLGIFLRVVSIESVYTAIFAPLVLEVISHIYS